jgi:hypothetical protein
MALISHGSSHYDIDSGGDYTIINDKTLQVAGRAAIAVIGNGHQHITIRLRARLVNSFGSGVVATGIEIYNATFVEIIGEGGALEGFQTGIRLEGCDQVTVRDLDIRNTLSQATRIDATNVQIINNRITTVGGTMLYPEPYNYGIRARGSNIEINHNHVRGVFTTTPAGEAVGISIDDCLGYAKVLYNNIEFGTQDIRDRGIWIGANSTNEADAIIAFNHITKAYHGIQCSSQVRGRIDTNVLYQSTVPLPSVSNVVIGPYNTVA